MGKTYKDNRKHRNIELDYLLPKRRIKKYKKNKAVILKKMNEDDWDDLRGELF